jgi:hypothetical protein
MRTYTSYKLTEAQCKKLAKMANGKDCGGVACQALERKGLAYSTPDSYGYTITIDGRNALAMARNEGW